MPSVDLYRHSNNPTPAQLIQACDDLLSQLLFKDSKPPIEEFLKSTEKLAEQIIGHYHNLPAVAQELAGFAKEGMKLPFAVMQVFIYACVREHASLGALLKEVNALYGDEQDQTALTAMAGILQHNALMMVPRPTLWAMNGALKHNPSVFCPIHSPAYIREVSGYFEKGEQGVRKILADYPQMDESSRKMLDRDLCKRVYRSLLSDDHPVRGVLQDKLNDVDDGLIRFQKLFERIDRKDDVGSFEDRFEHSFSLVESMPRDKVSQVFSGISQLLKEWMTGDAGLIRLAEPELVIERIVRVLERARPLGFEALPEVARYTLSSAKETPKLQIEHILDGGFRSEFGDVDTASAWAEASAIACEEEFLLSLGLSEKHLAILSGHKGTPGLRKALQNTETGREIVFGQDLGL